MSSKRFEIQFFIGLVVLAAALLALVFFPYLNSIVLAIVFTVLFRPVFQKIKKMMPNWSGVASFLTIILAIVVILVPISFFGFKIFQEAQDLYTRVEVGHSGALTEFLNERLAIVLPWLEIDFGQYLEKILSALTGSLGMIFSSVASSTMIIILSLFAFYYFLKDGEKINNGLLRISPLSEDFTKNILNELFSMATSVIRGSLVVAVVQGFLVGLGFFIFGLSGAVLWGSLAAITALIPLLGTGIVAIPAVIVLFVEGNFVNAFGFLFWSLLLVGLADNFLRPKLIGRKTHVHPLLVFFSVLGGLSVFGATGFLIGPLILSLFLALVKIYPLILREKSE